MFFSSARRSTSSASTFLGLSLIIFIAFNQLIQSQPIDRNNLESRMTVESDDHKTLEERGTVHQLDPHPPTSSQTPPPTNTQSSTSTSTTQTSGGSFASGGSLESVESADSNDFKPQERESDYASQEPTKDYIITLKQDTTQEQFDQYKKNLIRSGATIKHEYNSIILIGFAVSIKPSQLHSFQQDPQVAAIEPDGEVHTQASSSF